MATFLDEEYVDELITAGLKEIMLDLKAYDEGLHKQYTGFRIVLYYIMQGQFIGKSSSSSKQFTYR